MFDKNLLLAQLKQLPQADFIRLFEEKLVQLDNKTIHLLFGEVYYEKVVRQLSFREVFECIEAFEKKCNSMYYYDDFPLSASKYYDVITPLAQEWGEEMAIWLNRACEYALAQELTNALLCFKSLFDLLEKGNNSEIVYYHDGASALIYAKYDYKKIFKNMNIRL